MLTKFVSPRTKAELIRALQAATFSTVEVFEGEALAKVPPRCKATIEGRSSGGFAMNRIDRCRAIGKSTFKVVFWAGKYQNIVSRIQCLTNKFVRLSI